MFGLFESNDKKVERLHQEFLSYLDVVVELPDSERDNVLVAIGALLAGLRNEGLGDPLQVHGEPAKKMSAHLRHMAKSCAPKASLCYKLLATTVEAGGINSNLSAGFRAKANVVYQDAKLAYMQHIATNRNS